MMKDASKLEQSSREKKLIQQLQHGRKNMRASKLLTEAKNLIIMLKTDSITFYNDVIRQVIINPAHVRACLECVLSKD